jgi:hypothetical protein
MPFPRRLKVGDRGRGGMHRVTAFTHLFAGLALAVASGWIIATTYFAHTPAGAANEGSLILVPAMGSLVLIASWTQLALALPQAGAALLVLGQHRWGPRGLAVVSFVQLCVYLPVLWLLIEERVVVWMLAMVPLVALDVATLIAVRLQPRPAR